MLYGLALATLCACDRAKDAPVGEVALSELDVLFTGDPGDEVGASVASADLDGDGRADLLTSGLPRQAWISLAPHRGGALADEGRALSGCSGATAVAGLGDLDGDGDDEGAVALRLEGSMELARSSASGVIAVVDGGPEPGLDLIWLQDADAGALSQSGTVDYALTGPGDVDGDGLADLLVGQHGWGESNEGQIRLLSGARSEGDDLTDAPLILAGGADYHRLGASLGGGGDWDGDGLPDLAVGSGGEAEGVEAAVYLAQGVGDGLVQVADEAFARVVGDEALASAVGEARPGRGAGDLNGDGADDLLVMAGDALLIYGPVTGDHEVGAVADTVRGPEEGLVGGAVVGDLDQDGFDDLAVGDVGGFLGGETGEVYVFYGPVLGHADVAGADATLLGLEANSYTGADIAPAGDTNRDGYADLWVGAPGAFPSGSDDDGGRGAVALVTGGAR